VNVNTCRIRACIYASRLTFTLYRSNLYSEEVTNKYEEAGYQVKKLIVFHEFL